MHKSILSTLPAHYATDFPIPENGSCSFEVSGQWYTMRPRDNSIIEAKIGNEWTNQKIVEWCEKQGWRFQRCGYQGNFIHILPPTVKG